MPLPEPPSEAPSPSEPTGLQAQAIRGDLAQQLKFQAKPGLFKVVDDALLPSSVSPSPSKSESNLAKSLEETMAKEHTSLSVDHNLSAGVRVSPTAEDQARDLKGSLEALETSLHAARQSDSAKAVPHAPSAAADEAADGKVRAEVASPNEEQMAGDQNMQARSSDNPGAVPSEALESSSGKPADIPMLDGDAEKSPSDLPVQTPSPAHRAPADDGGVNVPAQSLSKQPVMHPASILSPVAQAVSVAEQQQQSEQAEDDAAKLAQDNDHAGMHAGQMLPDSMATEESLGDEVQPPETQQIADASALQEVQVSRSRLQQEVQNLDARVADISSQLERLQQAQSADDAEVKVPCRTNLFPCSHLHEA